MLPHVEEELALDGINLVRSAGLRGVRSFVLRGRLVDKIHYQSSGHCVLRVGGFSILWFWGFGPGCWVSRYYGKGSVFSGVYVPLVFFCFGGLFWDFLYKGRGAVFFRGSVSEGAFSGGWWCKFRITGG